MKKIEADSSAACGYGERSAAAPKFLEHLASPLKGSHETQKHL
jgi:hypothetical protein